MKLIIFILLFIYFAIFFLTIYLTIYFISNRKKTQELKREKELKSKHFFKLIKIIRSCKNEYHLYTCTSLIRNYESRFRDRKDVEVLYHEWSQVNYKIQCEINQKLRELILKPN